MSSGSPYTGEREIPAGFELLALLPPDEVVAEHQTTFPRRALELADALPDYVYEEIAASFQEDEA